MLKAFLKDKRGITPIMATVLLVSFAVAVGVVVMSFGRAEVEEEAVCPIDIGLAFAEISGKQDICFDGSQVRFTVENGININIEGLLVNVIGTEKAETADLTEAKLTKAGTYLGKVPFSGSIRQVKISPKVLLKAQEEICVEQSLVMENIPSC